jgi:hypothetical protein
MAEFIKLLVLNPTDDQSNFTYKCNSNFQRLIDIANGIVTIKGDKGVPGLPGINGSKGNDGEIGYSLLPYNGTSNQDYITWCNANNVRINDILLDYNSNSIKLITDLSNPANNTNLIDFNSIVASSISQNTSNSQKFDYMYNNSDIIVFSNTRESTFGNSNELGSTLLLNNFIYDSSNNSNEPITPPDYIINSKNHLLTIYADHGISNINSQSHNYTKGCILLGTKITGVDTHSSYRNSLKILHNYLPALLISESVFSMTDSNSSNPTATNTGIKFINSYIANVNNATWNNGFILFGNKQYFDANISAGSVKSEYTNAILICNKIDLISDNKFIALGQVGNNNIFALEIGTSVDEFQIKSYPNVSYSDTQKGIVFTDASIFTFSKTISGDDGHIYLRSAGNDIRCITPKGNFGIGRYNLDFKHIFSEKITSSLTSNNDNLFITTQCDVNTNLPTSLNNLFGIKIQPHTITNTSTDRNYYGGNVIISSSDFTGTSNKNYSGKVLIKSGNANNTSSVVIRTGQSISTSTTDSVNEIGNMIIGTSKLDYTTGGVTRKSGHIIFKSGSNFNTTSDTILNMYNSGISKGDIFIESDNRIIIDSKSSLTIKTSDYNIANNAVSETADLFIRTGDVSSSLVDADSGKIEISTPYRQQTYQTTKYSGGIYLKTGATYDSDGKVDNKQINEYNQSDITLDSGESGDINLYSSNYINIETKSTNGYINIKTGDYTTNMNNVCSIKKLNTSDVLTTHNGFVDNISSYRLWCTEYISHNGSVKLLRIRGRVLTGAIGGSHPAYIFTLKGDYRSTFEGGSGVNYMYSYAIKRTPPDNPLGIIPIVLQGDELSISSENLVSNTEYTFDITISFTQYDIIP